MTAWAPATAEGSWFFHPDQPRLLGLRATRQTGAGQDDGGGFTLFPQSGPLVTAPGARASAYRLDRSVLAPHRLRTEFLRYRITAELAPTDRCAVLRLTFGEAGAGRLIVEAPGGTVEWDGEAGELRGQNGPEGYLVLTFDRPVARWGGEGSRGWVEFAVSRGGVVEVRAATSRRSFDQARTNARAEVGDRTLDQVADEGAAVWERLLGRFEVEGGTEAQRTTFYSALYRVLCFPRKVHECGPDGVPLGGVLCTGRDLGPVARTVVPLYALAWRDELGDLLEGWARFAREAEDLGPAGDAVFAEAAAKGLPVPGTWSRSGEPEPADPASVSRTLAGAYGAWCRGQLARKAGRAAEAVAWDDRSKRWQDLFDPSMGFFRPRDAEGEWADGFNPLAWGGAFEGCSAWQGGWDVPHDPEGLVAALGGPEVTLARLDTLLALRPWFQAGAEGEIPPMTSMALADLGQYAHAVPTAHPILWYYCLAGRPEKTEGLTRRVVDELYGPGVDGLCGDDRQGSLGAWFVWAALGLYPFCPGSPDYLLGSPLFPKVTIHSGGADLVIEAVGGRGPAVRKRTLGNVILTDPRVSRADLVDLGRLVVELEG
jgi:putative alpha-1,2-mannosidase